MAFFFDSHIHPSLKKQFANPNEVPSSGLPTINPWKTTETKEFLKSLSLLVRCILRPFVASSLVSQASLTQLNNTNYKIAVIVLFAPDRGILKLITDNQQFNDILIKGKFGNILVEDRFTALETTNDAFSVVERDLDLLFRANSFGQKISKLIDSNFDPTDKDVLHAVFAIEGLHCLRRHIDETNPDFILSDILTNLENLLAGNFKVIAVNISHIDSSNTIFANQAYAADGFRESGLHEDQLRPTGNGFTDLGKRIAKELYKLEVLPDVKHMSWLSRKQFYEFRDIEKISAPIVCSHAGFTGCWFNKEGENSYKDYIISSQNTANSLGGIQRKIVLGKPTKSHLDPDAKPDGTAFNVSTINLFNEDIEAIFNSNGLIGLSLDQRILGFSDVIFGANDEPVTDNVSMNAQVMQDVNLVTDTEFLSEDELKVEPLFGKTSENQGKLADCLRLETFINLQLNSDNNKDFIHPRLFYMHILHAMQVAEQLGGEASIIKILTETLCIGSDLDGLIDGIDCCSDVTQISDFKNKFNEEFVKYLAEFGVSLPNILSVEKVADRIFYENGRDFVFKRLDAINQQPLLEVPVAP